MDKSRATYDHHKMLMFLLENETEWYSQSYRGQESWLLAVWYDDGEYKCQLFDSWTKIECLDRALNWIDDKKQGD